MRFDTMRSALGRKGDRVRFDVPVEIPVMTRMPVSTR